MGKYIKKQITIDAVQWFRAGDHKDVHNGSFVNDCKCESCGEEMVEHGIIQTLEGEMIACPGDWIITGVKGEVYPCKPDIFQMSYDKSDDAIKELANVNTEETKESVSDVMDFKEYQRLAARTMNADMDFPNIALGITGEAGEVAELIKKKVYHGHDISDEEIKVELGDLQWYVAAMATKIGVSLEDVAKSNIEKLEKRYSGSFSSEKSIKRVDTEKF